MGAWVGRVRFMRRGNNEGHGRVNLRESFDTRFCSPYLRIDTVMQLLLVFLVDDPLPPLTLSAFLDPDEPSRLPRRPSMQRTPALKPPPLRLLAVHQRQQLLPRPRPQRAHQAIQHDDDRHHGNHIRPEQVRPVPPEVIPARQPKHRAQHEGREQAAQGPRLQLEYGEAGGGGEGVAEDGAREWVREVVEGEGEEVEGLARGERLGRGGQGGQVARRGAGIDGLRDVVQVGGGGAGEFPRRDVREKVREDEVDGGVGGVVVGLIVACGAVCRGVGVFSPLGRGETFLFLVVLFDGFEREGFVDLMFESRGGPAGAGGEIDKNVVFYRRTEKGLKRMGD